MRERESQTSMWRKIVFIDCRTRRMVAKEKRLGIRKKIPKRTEHLRDREVHEMTNPFNK